MDTHPVQLGKDDQAVRRQQRVREMRGPTSLRNEYFALIVNFHQSAISAHPTFDLAVMGVLEIASTWPLGSRR